MILITTVEISLPFSTHSRWIVEAGRALRPVPPLKLPVGTPLVAQGKTTHGWEAEFWNEQDEAWEEIWIHGKEVRIA